MFKKGGGFDLRTTAGRAGKEQSDELMFMLFSFGIKVLFSFLLLLGIRVFWEALLVDFYDQFLRAAVGEPGFFSYATVISLTVFVTLYTPYAFFKHFRELKEDVFGFILISVILGLRWVLPSWIVFFFLMPVDQLTRW